MQARALLIVFRSVPCLHFRVVLSSICSCVRRAVSVQFFSDSNCRFLVQNLMEKTVVLTLATGQKKVSASLAKLVGTYAELLASQGLVDTALDYLAMIADDQAPQNLAILRDRLSSWKPGTAAGLF